MRSGDKGLIDSILKNKGATPRVNRNTLLFLYPSEHERTGFLTTIKKHIAYRYIQQDNSLHLSKEQKKEIEKELKKIDDGIKESIRRLYRTIAIPDKTGVKVLDLGIPTFGEDKSIDHEVYEKLRSESEILERIMPLVLKEKYLQGRDYVSTLQVYQSSLRTPGEMRFNNRSVLEQGISEGLKKGIYGVGELVGDKPVCRYFKEDASLSFSNNEVLINEHVCLKQKGVEIQPVRRPITYNTTGEEQPPMGERIGEYPKGYKYREILWFNFIVPKGKVSDIMRIITYLQSKFETIEIALCPSSQKTRC